VAAAVHVAQLQAIDQVLKTKSLTLKSSSRKISPYLPDLQNAAAAAGGLFSFSRITALN